MNSGQFLHVLRKYKLPKIEKDRPTTGSILLRQGEPGTSQYIDVQKKKLNRKQTFFKSRHVLLLIHNNNDGSTSIQNISIDIKNLMQFLLIFVLPIIKRDGLN